MATYRNEKLRRSADGESCVNCGAQDGTVVWGHSNQQVFGKGMGLKCSDAAGFYICGRCHTAHDQGRALSKSERRENEFEWIAKSLVRAIEKGVLK